MTKDAIVALRLACNLAGLARFKAARDARLAAKQEWVKGGGRWPNVSENSDSDDV